eukprot:TRINITY_DN15066_c0_g1_i1.p1 TRINITY_DN15066_c0_g1~~TRINITY_DN15066_c0_g1_i1.p1  ORF type:complete len:393 (+),score=77.86 TRINITY_DN15066_c0_g1_i1:32-1210(+)
MSPPPWGPTVGYHELGGSKWTVSDLDGVYKGVLSFQRIPFGAARVGEVSFDEGDRGCAKSTWSVTGTREVTIASLGRYERCTLKFNLNASGLCICGGAAIDGWRAFIVSCGEGANLQQFEYGSPDDAGAPVSSAGIDAALPTLSTALLPPDMLSRVLEAAGTSAEEIAAALDGTTELVDELAATSSKTQRCGGVLYSPPAGWTRYGLKLTTARDDWAMCSRVTHPEALSGLLSKGFRIGERHGALRASLKDARTGMPVGEGVYCTPSLAVAACFANGEERVSGRPPVSLDGRTLWLVVQCRVRPEAIQRPDNHKYVKTSNDEEREGIDGVFEWVVASTDDIQPCAVLMRDRDECIHTHQPKALLKPQLANLGVSSQVPDLVKASKGACCGLQ